MSRKEMVVIGFGDYKGQCGTTIIQQDYRIIERLGSKLMAKVPVVKAVKFTAIDLNHYKSIITQRRNQALLNSFLNIEDQDNSMELFTICEQAKNKIKAIDQEMRTTRVVAADLKIHKFMSSANASEMAAREYLVEFDDNLQLAVAKYKERDNIIRTFAEKNNMNYGQAENILRQNEYNASVFD